MCVRANHHGGVLGDGGHATRCYRPAADGPLSCFAGSLGQGCRNQLLEGE